MLLNNNKSAFRLFRRFSVAMQKSYALSVKQKEKQISRDYYNFNANKNSADEELDKEVSQQKIKGLDVPLEEPITAYFLTNHIGSNHKKWTNALQKHPELKAIKRQDILNSANTLKKLNFDVETILTKPLILYQNALTIQNRYTVLQECGFDPITLMLVSKYIVVLNKTVILLKSHGHMPYDVNVLENLCNCFTDIELRAQDFAQLKESMPLKQMREYVVNAYFRARLDMNDENISKLWRVYSRVRHRSFKSIQSIIKILLVDLRFPKERIIKNPYLLYADTENVRRIIKEIRSIDGQDIRDIVYRRPKILMSSCDALLRSLEYVKAYGISESAVTRCLEVLTLGPETILERLKDMHDIEEFKVLGTNPRILRLIHYQNKARLRLEYLNQLKVRCASLHILSGGSATFAKFAREGTDRSKGRDVIIYLANLFKKDINDIRNILSRHPNWCHIPVLQVKQCLEYLRSQHFTYSTIYNNLHVVLYPQQRIEEKLDQLYDPEFLEEFHVPVTNIFEVSNSEFLTLILYLIECEYHFTGDGIWTEQQINPVENFNNILPDFPDSENKIYKYGMKPSASKSTAVNSMGAAGGILAFRNFDEVI